MNVDDVVKNLAAKHFEVPSDEVDLDVPLAEASDSIGLSILVVALEQEFNVALEDSAIAKARCLRDLARIVEASLDPSGRA